MLASMNSTDAVNVMADPGVAAAWDKLQDLRGQVRDGEAALAAARVSIADAEEAERRERPIDRAARAVLGGDTVTDANLDRFRGKYQAVATRLPVLRRAADLQNRVYKDEVARASGAICENLRPRHREVVGAVAAALAELGRALVAEIEFRDELRAGGVQFAGDLDAMPVRGLGDPRDRNSAIAAWFLDAIERGLVDESVVPRAWRRAWK